MAELPTWLPNDGTSGQAETTPQRIMAAGRTTFRTYSYDRARVDDIVALAGISHGAFYRYFRNKEDLLRAMAVECATKLQALTAELEAMPRPVTREAIRAWIEKFVGIYHDDGPVIRVWLDNRDVDPLMQALANDALGPLTSALAGVVDAPTAAAIGAEFAGFGMLSLLERLSSYFVDIDPALVTETATRLMFAATVAAEPARA